MSRLVWLAVLALGVATPAPAEVAGSVFLDADRDGARGPAESGMAGVRVSNGREVRVTGADGAFSFDELPTGFVHVTRPDGFACERWYRRDGGDFALVPAPAPNAFFFVQISDIHAYGDARDFARYTLPDAPGWIPARLGAWALLWAMRGYYEGRDRDAIAASFRAALAPYRPVEDLSRSEVLVAFLEEFERPGSQLGQVTAAARDAFAEVAGLAPAFAIATGDLVIEGNTAPGGVVEGWFRLYQGLVAESGLEIYHTIGNNEIAGSKVEGFGPEDPRYGKQLFERFYGPTTFSFDRGPFHFVAADSHRRKDRDGRPPEWEFEELSPEVLAWLDADLAAHDDRVLVVLNHEPFHALPEWDTFYDAVDDHGLFAKHGVDYSLAGHIHRNGSERKGSTLHVTTGALSGMRWAVPPDLHPRGYRLFYARDRRLFSAWKELGKPVVGFVEPTSDPARFVAGGDAEPGRVVVAAADTRGPFAWLDVRLDGEPLMVTRWGDYFAEAQVPPGPAGRQLVLRAVRADGEAVTATAEAPAFE